jgi:DNA modification methylase
VKPYYDHGGVTIYHGDCREILPRITGDIVVMSPPYNTLPQSHKPSGLHAERKSGINRWIKKASDGYSDAMPEDEYQKWLRGIIGLCLESARGLVWMNHKVRYREGAAIHPLQFLPFPVYAEVIWDRGISMALNCKRYAPSHEGIWGFGKPNYWDDSLNTRMSVWRISPQRSDDHPCPYPMELVSPLIISSAKKGGLVIDPFMGSGTTLRAAKDLGRKAIGIEIEEKYCEIAVKRLAQEVLF